LIIIQYCTDHQREMPNREQLFRNKISFLFFLGRLGISNPLNADY